MKVTTRYSNLFIAFHYIFEIILETSEEDPKQREETLREILMYYM